MMRTYRIHKELIHRERLDVDWFGWRDWRWDWNFKPNVLDFLWTVQAGPVGIFFWRKSEDERLARLWNEQ